MKKKTVTFGISFPNEDVLDAAKNRAEELGLTFSTYINQLIRKDQGFPNATNIWVEHRYDPQSQSLKAIAEDPGPYQSKPPSPKKTG